MFHAFGHTVIAVAEDIRDQIILDLGVAADKVIVLRNAINLETFKYKPLAQPAVKPLVSIIGRLTGPKGELCLQLLKHVLDDLIVSEKITVRIITGGKTPHQFEKYSHLITHLKPSEDILESII
jgi:hypothetical protein